MAFEQKYFFEDVIGPFSRRHEGTQLSVRFGHSPREAQAVVDGQLDLAYVMRWHLPTDAEFEFLHDLRLTFVASRDHPLAGRRCITVCDIAEAGLITAPFIGAEESFYREVLREFGLTGDHSVIEVDGLQTRFLATAAGIGVMATFIPDHAREAVCAEFALLDVEGRPTTVQAGLVRRSDHPGSSTTDELAAWLRKLSAP